MDFYFITLAILFTLSNVFWAIVAFKLINRLMSRNFYEYKVAESVGTEAKKKQPKQQHEIDPRIMEELESLNAIIPGL